MNSARAIKDLGRGLPLPYSHTYGSKLDCSNALEGPDLGRPYSTLNGQGRPNEKDFFFFLIFFTPATTINLINQKLINMIS